MRDGVLKIGELARRAGVTVRTLHYYEEIRLLVPSQRTHTGHRLYTGGDVARLQQIRSLQQLGFGLADIRKLLQRPDWSPERVIDLHLNQVREQIGRLQRLASRLEGLTQHVRAAETLSIESLVEILEAMSMTEKYYTPDQQELIRQRAEAVGQERIEQSQREWQELMDAVKAEMDKGTDPTDPTVVALAQKWMSLIREFTGGDAGLHQSLNRMWHEETEIHSVQTAEVRAMGEYVQKALASEPGS
ncbi:MAG: MerR family transcriptional regulator [Chloroflexi bacterium]|nr:MerR family transcriptional regulator [Chloroflexota bacterium]